MLPVEPERAAKVKHQQPEPGNERLIRDAAEQLAHGRGVAHYAGLNALRQPRAAHGLTPPVPPLDAILAGYVSGFVVVRLDHPQ